MVKFPQDRVFSRRTEYYFAGIVKFPQGRILFRRKRIFSHRTPTNVRRTSDFGAGKGFPPSGKPILFQEG